MTHCYYWLRSCFSNSSDTLEQTFPKEIFLLLMYVKSAHISPKWKNSVHNTQHHTQWWEAASFSSKVRNKTRMPPFAILFNTVLDVPARASRQEIEVKDIQVSKKEIKLSLFAGDIILHRENPRDSPQKKC